MIKIIYDPVKGTPIPDELMEAEVEGLILVNEPDKLIERKYSNELMIHWIRLAVKEDRIPYLNIEFHHAAQVHPDWQEVRKIPHDKNGTFEYYPFGFLDNMSDVMSKLL